MRTASIFIACFSFLGACVFATQGAAPNSNWRSLGPINMPSVEPSMGRINAVVGHPTDTNRLYVCASGGGLWTSPDRGVTWTPLTDRLPVVGTTGVAIDPTNPNILYLATGDGDGYSAPSVGVWKSVNGGIDWAATGLSWPVSGSSKIHKLMLQPGNRNKLFAATTDGIYVSSNAGTNWVRSTPGGATIWYDLEFQPGNSNTVYLAGFGALFFRSTDGGTNWTQFTNGLPASAAVGRTALAVSPNLSQGVYFFCAAYADGSYYGLYRSTNAGTNFVQQSGAGVANIDFGQQGYYDLALAASPQNFNQVYVGGLVVARSSDGGITWSDIRSGAVSGQTHVDVHELTFINNDLYAGTDGGVHRTPDAGQNWTDLSGQLAITELFRVGGAPQNPNLTYVGAQDNGLNRLQNGVWSHVKAGDYSESIVDPTDESIVYTVVNGYFYKTTNAWATSSQLIISGEQASLEAPLVMHPTNPQILYAGFRNVFKTTNGGGTWQAISSFANSDLCTFIAVAPSNPNVIYCVRNSNLWRTSDGGINWTNITGSLSGRNAEAVAISFSDPNKIWVALGSYSTSNQVFRSTDGGTTWSNYSGTLPALPAQAIVYEGGSNDGLYVGLSAGVYYRDASLTDWAPFKTNLPNAIISELEIHYGSLKLRAATFGRGLWDTFLVGANPRPPVLSGPDLLTTNQLGSYTFNAVTKAIGYQWRQRRVLSYSLSDGAENGVTNFAVVSAGNYSLIESGIKAGGSFSFHLAQPDRKDQILTLNRTLLPRANSVLQFKSLLGQATVSQIAKLQVSADSGGTWQDLYSQPGNNSSEIAFSTRSIALSNYVGKALQVRFAYTYVAGGSYFPGTNAYVGWYLDDITITNMDEASMPSVTDIAGTNFNFSASNAGAYILEARAKVFGGYFLDYGPMRTITVTTNPVVQMTAIRYISASNKQIDFSVLSGLATNFQLYTATNVAGPYALDGAASIQTITPGSSYRATSTATGARRYYRIRVL